MEPTWDGGWWMVEEGRGKREEGEGEKVNKVGSWELGQGERVKGKGKGER